MAYEDTAAQDSGRSLSDDPLATLADLRRQLGVEKLRASVDGARLLTLFESAARLEEIYQWAKLMQLGAEGFDNLASARVYKELQERLVASLEDILKACEVLRSRLD